MGPLKGTLSFFCMGYSPGYDEELERRIRTLAQADGISLNQAALRLLRKGAGLGTSMADTNAIGPALDQFIGTWTKEEADELMDSVEDFEKIDGQLWK